MSAVAFNNLPKDIQVDHIATIKKTLVDAGKSFSDFKFNEEQLNLLAYSYCNNALYNKSNKMINSLLIQVEESNIIN